MTNNKQQTTNNRKDNYLLSVICYLLSENGQSILEVLIALTLIILFLSGVVVVQLFAVRNITYSENKSTATKLARQQLDRVRVVRDSAGIAALDPCQVACFINSDLSAVAVTPTGAFDQKVTLQSDSSECPPPEEDPDAITYKATVQVILKGTTTTPTPMAEMSGCITDWR